MICYKNDTSVICSEITCNFQIKNWSHVLFESTPLQPTAACFVFVKKKILAPTRIRKTFYWADSGPSVLL